MKQLLLTAAAVATTIISTAGVASADTIIPQPIKPVAAVTAPAAPAPQMVTIQPGDYLSKIAADHGTTYLRIFYANSNIINPDLIYPGNVIRIPDASETLTARALPTTAPAAIQTQVAANPAVDTQAETPPAPAVVAEPPVRPATPVAAPTVASGSVWDRLAACESGGNWSISTGNGFYGGLQFTLSSWAAVGGSGYPNQASREEQIARATILQSRQGWGAWPACSAKLGL